jgi:sulfoxide reductase heme-binding subunit YedZ
MTSPGVHLFWLLSRAAGTGSLVLTSVSLAVGLTIGSRLTSGRGRGADLRALHEVLSLSGMTLLLVHGLALLGDQYLHPTLSQIAIPFLGGYRPLWTGVGIIGGWGLLILGGSYYARRHIGQARWRKLHRLTIVAWLGGVIHTLGAGTDAHSAWYLALLGVTSAPALVLLLMRGFGLLGGERPVARPVASRLAE